MSPRRWSMRTLLPALAVVALAACSPATSEDTGASGTGSAGSGGTVTVLAAASLTEPLTALAEAYEQDHDGVRVALSFGSSTTLAQQIAEGAPVDVYASAGESALDLLPADAAQDGGRATIARNTVEIATPPDNPGGVAGLQDLADRDLDVVLCAETVPCGKAADEVLERAGISPHVVSREVDVKATLTKVTLGEADAAMVYHSDVVSAGSDVTGVEIPDADNVTLTYPLLWFSTDPDVVGFAQYVTGDAGRAALEKAGFLAP
ncbi:molybdate ABC transporter substrate-binding protein [Phycicoccus endophyticus]|uniref:Molybdate ABC transporter substrate-binding protein n=1 Tax=Phycicoccus endophyticus TaxID=1690220 RepID=A0A7G9R240_9MICO|nr:molybdate ABC transporter substrate-binding protein [Phycicoccus endophyticus]NHI19686.1 molybdate ABC transporter substrate-binding protein [Phycicoccus endophyticus]QNN49665.1 molybdate ABC transporter substrate-binding protein [Phycicoccus endophyticus]GGL33846.1 molybdenum ABC transporter ModA, periplasmic [Phycicoccus endophyticus]